jgi:predicted membrane chloride channel (bestrophin family)
MSTLYGGLIFWLHAWFEGGGLFNFSLPWDFMASWSFLIATLLAHRMTTANERWWEAMVLWQNIQEHTKELTSLVSTYCADRVLVGRIAMFAVAFAVATKNELRMGTGTENSRKKIRVGHSYRPNPKDLHADARAEVMGQAVAQEYHNFLSDTDVQLLKLVSRPASCCLDVIRSCVAQGIADGTMDQPEVCIPNIELQITGLSNANGGCARILQAPMPFTYFVHFRTLIVIHLLLLPWLLNNVDAFSWRTRLLLDFIINVSVLGIEQCSMKVENPFGDSMSALPLEVFCTRVFQDVSDILGRIDVSLVTVESMDEVRESYEQGTKVSKSGAPPPNLGRTRSVTTGGEPPSRTNQLRKTQSTMDIGVRTRSNTAMNSNLGMGTQRPVRRVSLLKFASTMRGQSSSKNGQHRTRNHLDTSKSVMKRKKMAGKTCAG